ncbi:hypothetical protein [Rhodopila sp.]|uniref:hypothetical protein n=1 Tax=Rhodopila sp. TaxID=2480087 RepID=UPI003D0CA9DB
MSNASTIILMPFLVAFLLFVGRFYFRERAGSKTSPSFLLALATIAIAAAYLILGVTNRLPEYGTIGFGVAGAGLLLLSIVRMFQL